MIDRVKDFSECRYIALCAKDENSFSWDDVKGTYTKDELWKLIENATEYSYFLVLSVEDEHIYKTHYTRECVSVRRLRGY